MLRGQCWKRWRINSTTSYLSTAYLVTRGYITFSAMKRFLAFWVFVTVAHSAAAQQLVGLWEGILYNDSTGQNTMYDIAITKKNGKLFGYSRTGFIINDQVYFGVKKLSLKQKDGKVLIKDEDLISNNYPVQPPKGIGQLSVLQFSVDGNDTLLAGEFFTNATKKYSPVTGSLRLVKKNGIKNSYLLPHLAALGLDKELSFISPDGPVAGLPMPASAASGIPAADTILKVRKDVVQQMVNFKTDSLYFSLYDNGEVDGDTVSIYLNNQPLLLRQGLSTRAINYTIATRELGNNFTLKMFAENLGTIPPNTGLLIIRDGKQRYEVRFSGSLDENAVIVFNREFN